MAEKEISIYCIATALDGEGDTYDPGDKVTCDTRAEAGKLLATGRFSEDKEAGERAKEVAKKKASQKAKSTPSIVPNDQSEKISALETQNAELTERLEALEKAPAKKSANNSKD